MRQRHSVVEKLINETDCADGEALQKQRSFRRRDLIVGVVVGLALIAFGAYCAMLNSAPWK